MGYKNEKVLENWNEIKGTFFEKFEFAKQCSAIFFGCMKYVAINFDIFFHLEP